MTTYRVEVYQIEPLEQVDTIFCQTSEEALELAISCTDFNHKASPIVEVDGATRLILE